MVRWSFHGLQQGECTGLAVGGRPVHYSGINILRIAAGKVSEIWELYNR
jgi:predicted ester cyclase